MPGQLVLLTLTALKPLDRQAELPAEPRAPFVVSGAFDHRAAATAGLAAPRGCSGVARLEALTVMTGGDPDPAPAMPSG